ncbi:hypothetical protein AOXY_G23305 [Acipenser oxyrinchus oxyrinchus]|uniref:PH domain-containing protein n=1 Tax=Acipenser oxyrinchus oxyrinchus TaxID=40147 RepID=A0AAD8FV34_ACIOX|nr:hypothetical protein AOXY_G23305 [Acipenser oxyrinchus oxyrinchus]
MQIIWSEEMEQIEILYLQCKSVNELNQWLSALRKSCIHNTETLNSYHPGVFKGDKWSCCHQKEKTAAGCDKTRHGVTLQEWNDPLDPDLESQLIFRHLLGVREAMRDKYLEVVKLEKDKDSFQSHEQDSELKDAASKLFQLLQDLQDIHEDLELRETENTNCLLELQT